MMSQNSKTYIGITLGPISRIMSYTRSMKSFWAASYFFSYLAKRLISDFQTGELKRVFLKPIMADKMWNTRDGVGRFPDQYIFESSDGDFDKLLDKRDDVFNDMADDIACILKKEDNTEDILDYLKDSVKVYICEMTDCDGQEVVERCQKRLAMMECMDIYPVTEDCNYLADYFENITNENNGRKSLLIEDAFGPVEDTSKPTKEDNRLFKTLIEFSAAEAIEKKKITAKALLSSAAAVAALDARYKYVAYVYADGDNVGKALRVLNTEMSSALLEFNTKISDVVEGRYGRVVFAGGDDIVFLSPSYTVFEIIREINRIFDETIDRVSEETNSGENENSVKNKKPISELLKENGLKRPTLSYGVFISYYKFPMGESLERAESLMSEAKATGRNKICWSLRKHSGQSIASSLDKNVSADSGKESSEFSDAMGLIDELSGQPKDFLHSFSHYLVLHKPVLETLLRESTPDECLENYISSTFSDDSHEKHKGLIGRFVKFLTRHKESGDVFDKLNAILRYVELIIKKTETPKQ